MYYLSPIGTLAITLEDSKIKQLSILASPPKEASSPADPAIEQALNTYFQYPHQPFSVKVEPVGTAFQKKIWQALMDIPPGATLTYGDLAKKCQTSPRAVGQACRRNPIPLIIPCHRVVAKGHIGGYTGETDGPILDIKQWLLTHEKKV